MDAEERTSYTTTGKASIICEGIAAFTLKDYNGEFHTLHTRIAYAPLSKYRIMAPQWLKMQGKEQRMAKDKHSR